MVDVDSFMDLPPGFRFHPTDEEVITHYLSQKILNHGFITAVIGEADLNKCEPWDLPSKAKIGEKEWYFFYHKDRKYPTGMRTNRATDSGYWKATGKDKEIFRGKGVLVGMKKTLVFYKGRAPRGEKSNWVMHEFRIEGKPISSNLPRTSKDEWVVCRVFHKITGALKKSPIMYGVANFSPYVEGLIDSSTLPTLMDPPYFNPLMKGIPQSSILEELQNQSKSFIPSNYFPLAGAPAGMGYSQAMPRPCKVEQFSMTSNEPNIDISSSVVSKHEVCWYDDLDDPSSSAAAAGENVDLWNMWDY